MEKWKPSIQVNEEKVVITIRLGENKLNEIENLSFKFDLSRNAFINQCIDFALKHIDLSEKNVKTKNIC